MVKLAKFWSCAGGPDAVYALREWHDNESEFLAWNMVSHMHTSVEEAICMLWTFYQAAAKQQLQ